MARYDCAFPAVVRMDGNQMVVAIPAFYRKMMKLRKGSRVYVYLAKAAPKKQEI